MSPSASPTRTSSRTEALVRRLHEYHPRPEYVQTPGPYTTTHSQNRRIDFVFRTTERFPTSTTTSMDDIDTDRACIEARSRVAFVPTEKRFLRPKSATTNCAVYNSVQGLDAIAPRSFAVQLPPHASDCSSSSSIPRTPQTVKQQSSQSQAIRERAEDSQRIIGGRIAKNGTRDVFDFLVHRTASPGPIYNPSQDGIRPNVLGMKFSTQPRLQATETSNRSSSTGSDCSLDAFRLLSTWPKAPAINMGKPPVAFVHPNRQLAPPPPEEIAAAQGTPVRTVRQKQKSKLGLLHGGEKQEMDSQPIHCTEGGGKLSEDEFRSIEEEAADDELSRCLRNATTSPTLYDWGVANGEHANQRTNKLTPEASAPSQQSNRSAIQERCPSTSSRRPYSALDAPFRRCPTPVSTTISVGNVTLHSIAETTEKSASRKKSKTKVKWTAAKREHFDEDVTSSVSRSAPDSTKGSRVSLSQTLFHNGLRSSKFPLLLREDYFSPESREAVQEVLKRHFNAREHHLRTHGEEGRSWKSSETMRKQNEGATIQV